jgi:hypothetical protein
MWGDYAFICNSGLLNNHSFKNKQKFIFVSIFKVFSFWSLCFLMLYFSSCFLFNNISY